MTSPTPHACLPRSFAHEDDVREVMGEKSRALEKEENKVKRDQLRTLAQREVVVKQETRAVYLEAERLKRAMKARADLENRKLEPRERGNSITASWMTDSIWVSQLAITQQHDTKPTVDLDIARKERIRAIGKPKRLRKRHRMLDSPPESASTSAGMVAGVPTP